MTNEEIYLDALRRIAEACAQPFGKDARRARRIALDAIKVGETWGAGK